MGPGITPVTRFSAEASSRSRGATPCPPLDSETRRLVRFGYCFRFTKPVLPEKNIRHGSHAVSTSSTPGSPSNFKHEIASGGQRLLIRPPGGPKIPESRSQHIVLAESTAYRFSPCPAMYTVDRRESVCPLSEFGSVPHLARRSRIAIVRRRSPFPGSWRPPPSTGVFWLCSVLLAKWPVSGRDYYQAASCSPGRECPSQ